MAALSIGTHLSPLQQFKKRSLHSPYLASVSSLHSLSSFGTYQCRIRGPRLLGNGVLTRAEDKARESSSSIQQEAQQQPNNQKQFQVLFYILYHEKLKVFMSSQLLFPSCLLILWLLIGDLIKHL